MGAMMPRAAGRGRPVQASRRATAPAGGGRRFFAPIGVPAPGGMLRELVAVGDDLSRMKRAFAGLDYSQVETPANPSVAEIRDMLGVQLDQSRLGHADALVLYFSGHGTVVGGDHYLCARGFARDDVATTGIKTRDLIELVVRRRSRPGRLWLILDCCQAGGVIEEGVLATIAATGADAFMLAAAGSWDSTQDGMFSRAFCAAVREITRAGQGLSGSLDALTQDINRRCSRGLRAIQATVSRARFDLLDAPR